MNDLLDKAIEFAACAHRGQTRNDKVTPYIVHPLQVMEMLIQLGVRDVKLLVAAVLHDILEECPNVTPVMLSHSFGAIITSMVQDLSFFPTTEESTEKKRQKLEYLKSFDTKPIGVVVVKVVDRIRNTKDFIAAGSVSYAKKYWGYADPLFETLMRRQDEFDLSDKLIRLVEDVGNFDF